MKVFAIVGIAAIGAGLVGYTLGYNMQLNQQQRAEIYSLAYQIAKTLCPVM